MTTSPEPCLALLEGYSAAVLAKDLDAFVALYDEDIHVFDMWDDWSSSGIAPWRAMTAQWFDSLGTERVAVSFSEVRCSAVAELAVIHAFVTYRALAPDGAELRSLDNRITLALALKPQCWKIVHQHTSSPIDAETARFRLKRA